METFDIKKLLADEDVELKKAFAEDREFYGGLERERQYYLKKWLEDTGLIMLDDIEGEK